MKLKKIINENMYLGELPSSKLPKMKWNPLTEAGMDKRFAKEFETSCKAFINHIKHELESAEGSDKSVLKKMKKNLETVAGYPKLMGKLVGYE